MSKHGRLTPLQRVEAALTLLEHEGRRSAISISAICRLAQVNRSNLYERHPKVLSAIRRARSEVQKREPSPEKGTALLKAELRQVKGQYKALLRLALEQQAEIESLRKRLRIERIQERRPNGSTSIRTTRAQS